MELIPYEFLEENLENLSEVRCYGVYGCFPLNYPWKSEQRAFAVFPFSPSILNVNFILFTSNSPNSPQIIHLDDPLTTFGIDKSEQIFLIIHGFIEFGNSPWMVKLKDEIFKFNPKSTVILVDWRGGSSPPYFQAVANIRVVGAIVAHFLMTMKVELKMASLGNFHLIGHSLGAHLSGYAGYYVQRDFEEKIGRISGLDPAKPYFEFTPEIVRLDKSDADFVDVIHTDSSLFVQNSFGIRQPIGHVDFYPNDGKFQPPCRNLSLINPDVTCNHRHAIELFTESVNTKCPFMSISCENYEKFTSGNCSKCNNLSGNFCIKFGFHARESFRETFPTFSPPFLSNFLLTSANEPFCQTHFKVVLKMSNQPADVGKLKIQLFGAQKSSHEIELSKKEILFESGEIFSFFIASEDIGPIESVNLNYDNRLSLLRVFGEELFVDFLTVESLESGQTIKLCTRDQKPLKSWINSRMRKEFC